MCDLLWSDPDGELTCAVLHKKPAAALTSQTYKAGACHREEPGSYLART